MNLVLIPFYQSKIFWHQQRIFASALSDPGLWSSGPLVVGGMHHSGLVTDMHHWLPHCLNPIITPSLQTDTEATTLEALKSQRSQCHKTHIHKQKGLQILISSLEKSGSTLGASGCKMNTKLTSDNGYTPKFGRHFLNIAFQIFWHFEVFLLMKLYSNETCGHICSTHCSLAVYLSYTTNISTFLQNILTKQIY